MSDDAATLPKKRGRPAKAENERKNTYLGFRVRDGMREKLEAAAEAGSRSPSEEIERRLIKSFENEDRIAFQDEIKSEMRGTIAALESRIALMEQGDNLLWPDKASRALGKAFAMTLTAVRHATGQDWRESPIAAPIVAGVVHRIVTKFGRPVGLLAGLAVDERVPTAISAITESLSDYLDKTMPPLPPLPQQEHAPSATRVRMVHTFKDKATGQILDTFTSRDFDLMDAADRPEPDAGYLAALERHRPRRDTIKVETVFAPATVPEAWDVTADGISFHRATPEEAVRDFEAVRDPKRPPEVFDGSDFAGIGLEEVSGPDDGSEPPAPPPAAAPTPRRRARAKT